MQKLDHALALAGEGFRVFPLLPNDKPPAVDEWPRKATTSTATIKKHWRTNPQDNIGIAAGHGIVILDIDVKDGKQGEKALMVLELEHGDLPPTRSSETPTGGRHLFFRTSRPIGNSASKIGQGLDIRGEGGYVVAPGSSTDKGEYRWQDDQPMAEAPEWLLDLAGRHRERDRQSDSVGALNTAEAIQRAAKWLQQAEPAIQGAAGDIATYKLAARILDFGCSADVALDLMLEHWNERCSPPWPPEELQRKIQNAAEYRQEPIGSKNPEAEFDPVDDADINQKRVNQESARKSPLKAKLAAIPPDDVLFPPDWQWGHYAARGYMGVIVAAPGVGKTNLMLAAAVAKAVGKDDIVGEVHGAGRVWFISGEDSVDDIYKRLAGVLKLHGVAREDLADRLFVNSAQDETIRLATIDPGRSVNQVDANAIAAQCKENKIDLLILDPLIEFHTVDENSNNEMSEVGSIVRSIAWDANCAVLVVHHTRKRDKASAAGQEGDMDSARGAGATSGKARTGFTLTGMSEKRAKEYGIPDGKRNRYIGLDTGKNNLAPRGDTVWFEQVGVDVGPNGLQVGAVRMADLEPAPASDGTDAALMALVVDGFLSTVGEGKWVGIGRLVEHVMAHDAFWRCREESGVRKHIRAAISSAIEEGADPSGRWRVDRQGDAKRQILYRIEATGETPNESA